jgi:hypothetical protein
MPQTPHVEKHFNMVHDDGNGVCVLVESDVKFVVRHLFDGSICLELAGIESVDEG